MMSQAIKKEMEILGPVGRAIIFLHFLVRLINEKIEDEDKQIKLRPYDMHDASVNGLSYLKYIRDEVEKKRKEETISIILLLRNNAATDRSARFSREGRQVADTKDKVQKEKCIPQELVPESSFDNATQALQSFNDLFKTEGGVGEYIFWFKDKGLQYRANQAESQAEVSRKKAAEEAAKKLATPEEKDRMTAEGARRAVAVQAREQQASEEAGEAEEAQPMQEEKKPPAEEAVRDFETKLGDVFESKQELEKHTFTSLIELSHRFPNHKASDAINNLIINIKSAYKGHKIIKEDVFALEKVLSGAILKQDEELKQIIETGALKLGELIQERARINAELEAEQAKERIISEITEKLKFTELKDLKNDFVAWGKKKLDNLPKRGQKALEQINAQLVGLIDNAKKIDSQQVRIEVADGLSDGLSSDLKKFNNDDVLEEADNELVAKVSQLAQKEKKEEGQKAEQIKRESKGESKQQPPHEEKITFRNIQDAISEIEAAAKIGVAGRQYFINELKAADDKHSHKQLLCFAAQLVKELNKTKNDNDHAKLFADARFRLALLELERASTKRDKSPVLTKPAHKLYKKFHSDYVVGKINDSNFQQLTNVVKGATKCVNNPSPNNLQEYQKHLDTASDKTYIGKTPWRRTKTAALCIGILLITAGIVVEALSMAGVISGWGGPFAIFGFKIGWDLILGGLELCVTGVGMSLLQNNSLFNKAQELEKEVVNTVYLPSKHKNHLF